MHVWRSTRTIPSARLNDAPVGQTSTHGGSAQCWHIIGNERVSPLWWVISILRIHCDDVAVFAPDSPFSLSHATTHASQSDAQRLTSTSMPQRTLFEAPSAAGRPCARSKSVMPGAIVTP